MKNLLKLGVVAFAAILFSSACSTSRTTGDGSDTTIVDSSASSTTIPDTISDTTKTDTIIDTMARR